MAHKRPFKPADAPDWLLVCGHTAWSWPYITHFGERGGHKYLICDICGGEKRVKKEEVTASQALATQQELRRLKLW